MDIEKELKEIIFNNKTNDDIVINLEQNIADLMKKAYLFKVISAAQKIENIISDDFIKNNDIKSLNFQCVYSGYYSIRINITNKKKTRIAYEKKENMTKLIMMIAQYTKELEYIEPNWTNLTHYYANEKNIELKPGIGKEIIDSLLSKELIALYNYTKMNLELEQSNDKKNKKNKL